MATVVPSGESHVLGAVPTPCILQKVELGPEANQVQSWEAREQENFTINEHEFDVWEMGGVARVEYEWPFYGMLDKGGGNTASARPRFSVYAEDPESLVHIRSRSTHLFPWHS
ncbi:hypothetical protein PIIN_10604 [Serendipita indica DSM 11827]|uniref:Uncharacterized protein n=1 Tax=Serendipita indica (strain DSM 11827) TaxID=1109443 RepID=G4TZ70_SERID|nr:hypothetical protein PIIN_10604 [Serendipita indica DSM 11827]